MQVPKEEVRERILQSAKEEFSKKGYHHSSLRIIAKNASLTPGNIYAYFRDKEHLLDEILSPLVQTLNEAITHAFESSTRFCGIDSITEAICTIYLQYRKEFVILLNGCQNTKYANAKEIISNLVYIRIKDDYFPMLNIDGDEILALAYTESLLSGLFSILLNSTENENQLRRNVNNYLSLMFQNQNEGENHAAFCTT